MTPFAELSTSTRLNSINSGFSTDSTPPQAFGVNAFGEGVRFEYDPAARSIAVDNGPGSPTFVAGELDMAAPAGTIRYVKANGQQLTLVQPAPGGTGLRWLRFIEFTGTTPRPSRTVAVTGIPTPVAAIPTTGTVGYARTLVIGEAFAQVNGQTIAYSLSPSTVTVSIDYAARRINFNLSVIGRPTTGGADVTLVTIAGTTDFDGGAPRVTISSDTYALHEPFVIGAALFGDAAAEAGGLFVYRGSSANRTNNIQLVGRIAAAR